MRASLLAALEGWAASLAVTLPVIAAVMWQDRPPAGVGLVLGEAAALWAGVTAVVALLGWLVLGVPLAMVLPAGLLVRRRWWIALAASVLVVWVIGREVGLFHKPEGNQPGGAWKGREFWNTALWAVVYAGVTVLRFARRVRKV